MARFWSPLHAIESNFKISTAHAVRRGGWARQTWAKVFWAIIFVIVFVTFCFCIYKLIQTYSDGLVVTTETRESSGEAPPFPTVTACDLSLYSTNNVHNIVLYYAYNGYVRSVQSYVSKIDLGSDYGTCFTISTTEPASDSGSDHGLDLIMYQPKSRLSSNAEMAGFRATVHPPNTRPMMDHQGFFVPTGYETLVGSEWRNAERMDSNGCTNDGKDGIYKRSASTCDHECSTADCVCKPPCSDNHYKTELSVTEWPSKYLRNTMNQSLVPIVKSLNLPTPPNDLAWLQDLAVLKVFFKDYHVTKVEEQAAYTAAELLTHIGGLSALCIGFSFLTLFEAVDLLISIFHTDNKHDDERPLSGGETGKRG